MSPAPGTSRDVDLKSIEQALRDASASIDGVKHVQASRAMRIVGCPGQTHRHWQRRGLLRSITIQCSKTNRSPNGRILALHLEDLLGCLDRYQPGTRMRWTSLQDDYLREWYGRRGIARIASDLGRPVKGVQYRANMIGLETRSAQGLYSTGLAGKLLGVSGSRVKGWCTRSRDQLHHIRTPDKKRARLIALRDLRLFLIRNPKFRRGISLVALARLERLAHSRSYARKKAA